jgi:Zn-dependent peptidase ImmA (M78 family)
MPARRLSDFEARSVAERQATKLLQLLETREPPVEVALIADLPRIDVRVAALKRGMSGETEWRDGRWHITVRRNDSTMRRRFTLGHEFKHVLDHPAIRVAYGDQRDERAQQRAERMCDYFAACLLMPRAWVKREWGAGNQRPMALARQFRV